MLPGEQAWTSSGIAYVQTALARDMLTEAAASIRAHDDETAHATIQSVIRQLETAARMLR